MFIYRIYDKDGEELGEAAYTQRIKPGETVWLSGARMVEGACPRNQSMRIARL